MCAGASRGGRSVRCAPPPLAESIVHTSTASAAAGNRCVMSALKGATVLLRNVNTKT